MNNNTIKCVAIDDEPLALEVIRKFCERIGGIDVQTFSDPAAGLDVIKREKPSIAFLDIEMENISGLTIASQLPPETCFIFTTAYLNYAMDGFELDAVDYLHKPFAFSRFQTAFAKAVRRIEGASRPREDNRSLMVKQEYNTVNVPLRSILYIEAMEGYVKIFREDGICTVSRIILKNVGSQLPEEDFLRIHRSFIVSKSKIKSFNRQSVTLSSGVTLPIGRQYVNDMMRMLNC
ncbi:MAG: LytTR family DNA-binding domain-containing protein [Duncaniella sp.]|jgi:DNA-binding LytR/AlgR family response regulator|uniref:LytR/AlgR family response regulator transcription factor n=1 Tax=Duncaniella muricolitica TaxID=2880704 RepID=UPI00244E0A36|nr:LytTR family DNA-binding domain-containing protein [Duncaniella muricolitica]MCX4369342.1 LytTR family DNA-binding domain-containing protein [Duncaniella sp.]